jgi:hypothetical protein
MTTTADRRLLLGMGLCPDCCRRRSKGSVRCVRCKLRHSARANAEKSRRRRAGLCTVSGCPARSLPGYAVCDVHRVIQNVQRLDLYYAAKGGSRVVADPVTLDQARFMVLGGAKFGDVYPLLVPDDRRPFKDWFVNEPAVPARAPSPTDMIIAARDMGYTGDACPNCQSMKMTRAGSCMRCQDCGNSDGGCG